MSSLNPVSINRANAALPINTENTDLQVDQEIKKTSQLLKKCPSGLERLLSATQSPKSPVPYQMTTGTITKRYGSNPESLLTTTTPSDRGTKVGSNPIGEETE